MAWYRNFLENFQKIRKLSNYFLIEKKLAKIKFGYTSRAEVLLFSENFGSVPFPQHAVTGKCCSIRLWTILRN